VLNSRRIALDVLMVAAPNPGPKTLQGTNCYIVGRRQSLVIDAGPDMPAFQDELAGLLGDSVSDILLTHDHPDHAGGAAYLASLLGARLWANDAPQGDTQEATKPTSDRQTSKTERRAPNSECRRATADARTTSAEHRTPNTEHRMPDHFEVEDKSLRVVPSPGHSWDHVCFLLEPDRLLFSGDTILGEGTTLIARPEGDMAVYLDTLQRLKALSPTAIAPGHGPFVSRPIEKIDEYIQHREQREKELLACLVEPRTVRELVANIYMPTDRETRRLAELSVEAQLAKLVKERRVGELSAGRYWVRASS
jgi:glyoxylase-like metal-dependent hydrolase (beta-lactamase superfamily II)